MSTEWRDVVGPNLVGVVEAEAERLRGELPVRRPRRGPRGLTWLGSPNYTAGRQGQRVEMVVLHSMVGTTVGANARFQNPREYASAHYGVSLDGSMVQWVDERNTAWHAGVWGVNLRSIGIEHEDGGQHTGPRTPQLYAAAHRLAAEVASRHGVPLVLVTRPAAGFLGHNRTGYATACPSTLDLMRIIKGGEVVDPAEVLRVIEARYDLAGTIAAIKKRLEIDAHHTHPSGEPIEKVSRRKAVHQPPRKGRRAGQGSRAARRGRGAGTRGG